MLPKLGANWKLSLNATSVSTRLTRPNAQAAAILPLMIVPRAAGVASKRLQRIALALAGGGVDHQVGAAEEGAQDQQVGQERQRLAAPRFRRGQVAVADAQRLR